MNDNTKTNNEKGAAEDYLRQNEAKYLVSATSGLYYPKPSEPTQQTNIQVEASLRDQIVISQDPRANWAARFTAIAAWFGVVISIFTLAGLALAAYLASGQWRQMIIANQNAEHALEETRKSNVSSSSAFVASQRAYMTVAVTFQFVQQASDPNQLDELMAYPAWTNSGLTPTQNLIMHGSWIDHPPPIKNGFVDLWGPSEPHKNIRVVLGPKAVAIGNIVHIKVSQMRDMADGKGPPVFMYGWARYRDVFPGTTVHLTEYCWQVQVRRISGGLPQPRETFAPTNPPCDRYNCADKECKDYKEKLLLK